jgi:hypothetical protein
MASPEYERFTQMIRNSPKMVEMPLERQRAAGEHAEDFTAAPEGVTYETVDADGVRAVWATTANAAEECALLYLFGGGYVISSPHSRRKFSGHLARAAGCPVLVPGYRLAPEHPFPAPSTTVPPPTGGCCARAFGLSTWRSPGNRPAAGSPWRRCWPCAVPALPCRPRRSRCRRGWIWISSRSASGSTPRPAAPSPRSAGGCARAWGSPLPRDAMPAPRPASRTPAGGTTIAPGPRSGRRRPRPP